MWMPTHNSVGDSHGLLQFAGLAVLAALTAAAAVLLLIVLAMLILIALHLVCDSLAFLRRRDSLHGQLVLITGAAGGLGSELALSFARAGARLILWDVRAACLESLCLRLVGGGFASNLVHTAVVDVSDVDAVNAAAARVRHLGNVRVLVNNAAIVHGVTVAEATAEELHSSMCTNFLSHAWVLRAFLPQMTATGENRRATIVTLSSLMASMPAARLADYCAAKAAVTQLHECMQWEACRGHARGRHGYALRWLLVSSYMLTTPLFEGGVVGRWRLLRWLLPPLDAAYAAERIVRAVQTRQRVLVLPMWLKLLPACLMIMPLALRDVLLDLAGARVAMDGFKRRRDVLAPKGE